MDFSDESTPALLLVDNGSLRPTATLALRRIAHALSARIGRRVEAVSLLHSDKVSPSEIDHVPAETLESALRQRHAAGTTRFLLLPLFFGPSGALTVYIPRRLTSLGGDLAGLECNIADPVGGRDPLLPDPRLATILAEQVRATMQRLGITRPLVVMVDHGSPQRAVTDLRNRVAARLAQALDDNACAVVPASMERRDGTAYDFNEPLLEHALAAPPCGDEAGDVVVAPLFFSPGRHAGPGGDIETIARTAESQHRGLRIHIAPLVGEHPLLIEVLADRYREAMQR